MDLSKFLTREQVQADLGLSLKTIQRLVVSGQLKQRLREQVGRPAVAVYDPEQIEALRVKRGIPKAAAAHQAQPSTTTAPAVGFERKLWLTMREAALVSGLSLAFLKRKRNNQELPAMRDGQVWKVYRPWLERYIPSEFQAAYDALTGHDQDKSLGVEYGLLNTGPE